MQFKNIKSETLNLRVSPIFKLALKEAAMLEQRSMVNMLEVILKEYCEKKGVVYGAVSKGDIQKRKLVANRANIDSAA